MGYINKDQLRGMMTAVKNHVNNKCGSVYNDAKQLLYYHVTYDELCNLSETSSLIPGASYVISDYSASTIQEGTEVFNSYVGASHIIVTAHTPSRLNELGKMIFSIGPKWEFDIKYSLLNDQDRFAWADNLDRTFYRFTWKSIDTGSRVVPGCEMAIEYEEINNQEVLEIDGLNYYRLDANDEWRYYVLADDIRPKDDYDVETDTIHLAIIDYRGTTYKLTSPISAALSFSIRCYGKGVIYYMKDMYGNEVPYDFLNITFNKNHTFGHVSGWQSIRNCKIVPAYEDGVQVLNNIVILGPNRDTKVTIEQNCRNLRLNNISGDITIHAGVQGTLENPIWFQAFSENTHVYTNEGEIAETSPNIIIRRLDEIQEDTRAIKTRDYFYPQEVETESGNQWRVFLKAKSSGDKETRYEILSISSKGLSDERESLPIVQVWGSSGEILTTEGPFELYQTGGNKQDSADLDYGYDRINFTKSVVERHCKVIPIKELVNSIPTKVESNNTFSFSSSTGNGRLQIRINAILETYPELYLSGSTKPKFKLCKLSQSTQGLTASKISSTNIVIDNFATTDYTGGTWLDCVEYLSTQDFCIVIKRQEPELQTFSECGINVLKTMFTRPKSTNAWIDLGANIDGCVELAYLSTTEYLYTKDQIDNKFYTKTYCDSNFLKESNFKTINGESIVGEGNLIIEGSGSGSSIKRADYADDPDYIYAKFDGIQTSIGSHYALPDTQNTNEDFVIVTKDKLKTINGQSVFGTGNIVIEGGGGGGEVVQDTPNWDASSEEPGYINNRTHYIDRLSKVSVDPNTGRFIYHDNLLYYPIKFETIWNNTILMKGSELVDNTFWDIDGIFQFTFRFDDEGLYLESDGELQYIIANVSFYIVENMVYLPSGYIPDNIARISDVNTAISEAITKTLNTEV